MFTETDKRLVFKFLEMNYPVSKIKIIDKNPIINNRFKRAIVFEDGVYMLGDENQRIKLKFKLNDVIIKVFDCNSSISLSVLDIFLRLK